MCGSDALERETEIGDQGMSIEDMMSIAYVLNDQRMSWQHFNNISGSGIKVTVPKFGYQTHPFRTPGLT